MGSFLASTESQRKGVMKRPSTPRNLYWKSICEVLAGGRNGQILSFISNVTQVVPTNVSATADQTTAEPGLIDKQISTTVPTQTRFTPGIAVMTTQVIPKINSI